MPERPWEVWDENTAKELEQAWGPPTKGKNTRHQQLVKTVSKLILGKSVLDVGCGLGHLYGVIRGKVGIYLGVDSSPVMIRRAQSYFGKSLFVVGDAYDLSPLPSADTVICLDVVKHVPETWPILRQLWSKARKCVILVTNVGPRQHTRKTPHPEGTYLIYRAETIDNLMALFKKLSDVGAIDQIPFNSTKGTVIFRVHKRLDKDKGLK